jgi:hypothetical protein
MCWFKRHRILGLGLGLGLGFAGSLSFPRVSLSLSLPLNLTSGFARLGLVGRGAWASAGGRGSGSGLGSACWATVPDLAIFCRSTFQHKFGGGRQWNPAAGGAEQVVGLKLVELFERKNIGRFSCLMYFSLLMKCQLFIECYKTSLLRSILIE